MEPYNQLIDTKDLQKKIDFGYDLNIKCILGQTFVHFKKDVGMYALLSFVMMVLLMLSSLTIIGALLVTFPLTMGFSYAALKADLGEPIKLKHHFKGFNKMGSLVLLMFIELAILSVVFVPFYFIMWQNGMLDPAFAMGQAEIPDVFYWWIVFVLILSVILNAALFFAPYLIFYGDFSPMAAVRTSWQLAQKNLLKIIVLLLALSFIAMLGVVIFGFGMFLSLPLASVGYYVFIKNVLFSKK